jgi:TolB protein
LIALLAAAALAAIACDGGGDGAGPTPTAGGAPTATAAPSLRLLFYSDRDGDDDVYTSALDGSDLRQLTDDPGRDYEAAASHDGRLIAFSSERAGEPGSQLFLMDPDGSNVRRLTFSSQEGSRIVDDYACWAPDNRRLVFQRTTIPEEGAPDADVWLIDIETGEETQLTDTPDDWDSTPSFAPDGRGVLFESDRGGDYDVYRLDLTTMEVTRLVESTDRELQVKESPLDGSLLFISNRDGDFEIYAADPDGSNVRQLTANENDDRYPRWSPDGRQILFNSDRSGNTEVYVMNADGSAVRQLTDDPGRDADPHWVNVD